MLEDIRPYSNQVRVVSVYNSIYHLDPLQFFMHHAYQILHSVPVYWELQFNNKNQEKK